VGIGLLGALTVTGDEGPIEVAAAKERVILATLALDVGRTVAVSELTDALWGDAPPPTAVKTLQTYVARLRRTLPDGWIATIAGGYALTVDPATVDVWRFERAVAAGRAATEGGRHAEARARLAEAVALWRGPAVADLGDHPQGQAAATRLVELRLSAEEDLADARLAGGEDGSLVADLEAAARREPLRERRWVQLMLALYRSGRQGDALRAYQWARGALVEGLGIEPGPELVAMERAIIDQDPALVASRDPATGAEPQVLAALPPGLVAITAPPMAGRAAELERIAERWREVQRGACRAVIAHGEPGIGKTRLIGEAARAAHADGGLVLFGRCEREALTPYQAIVDALRTYVRTIPRAALASAAVWQSAELARLVPEAGSRLGIDPGPLLDEPAARHRLFDAVATFLARRTEQRPVVLVIDDLQWIDRGGGALLRHLLRACGHRFLLLASHRSADASGDASLAEAVAQTPTEAAPTLLRVGSLDDDAVHELAGGDHRDAIAIREATGGSPLFLGELLRFRAATGRLPAPAEIPPGVRQAVGRRIAELSPRARRLVEVTAVAGTVRSTVELAAAGGVGESDAIDLVDEAMSAHVLCEQPDAPGQVVFTHDLVRGAVLQGLSGTRRTYLHRRVAGAVRDHVRDDPLPRAAEIAHHLAAAAGDASDPEVVRWATTAGNHALAQLAGETAAAHFDLAVAHLPAGPSVARADLLADRGRALRLAGSESHAKRAFAEAVEVARAIGDRERAANIVLTWTSIPVDVRRELGETIGVLQDALDDLPTGDDPLRAQLMARLAFSLAWARHPEARATADAAIAMARRTGDRGALARALQYSTSSRDQFEAYDPAGCAGELHGLLPEIDDPVLAAQALYSWLTGCIQRADHSGVDRALGELHGLVERHRLLEAEFRLAALEGHLALGRGQVDVADRVAADLLDRAARTDLRNLFLFASALLYDVRRAQGRLAELLGWFDRVAAGEDIPRTRAMRVQVLAAAGREDAAADELRSMVGDRLASLAPAERPHSLATLADVAVHLGDADAAGAIRRQLEGWSGLVVYDGVNGPVEPVDDYLARLGETIAG
jgi:DNA-binding SARP family transcriptional activator